MLTFLQRHRKIKGCDLGTLVSTFQDMCERCRSILVGYSRKHSPDECPLLSVAFCPNCAMYGHYLSQCKDMEMLENAQPKYIEQLIPHTQISQFRIHTLTPLPSNMHNEDQLTSNQWYPANHDAILSVRYEADEIKSTLHKYKVEFNEKGKKEDNAHLLENLAKRLGRKLVWAKNSSDPVEKKNEKSQKQTAPTQTKNPEKKKKPLKIAAS
jgi:hypothetical protein